MQLLDDTESRPQCITQHADFNDVCLCRAFLTVSLYSHRHRYGTNDVPTDENRYACRMLFDVLILFSIGDSSICHIAN